ncbi:MAG: RNA polymerase factor sigma-54 [Kiritimatiellae bacterium]|nr:RNA polymerase factor sigma-54 [Kiritimatiellia bacterium]
MSLELGQSQRLKQTLSVTPQQLQGLRLLAKSLPELRAEIVAEMARNPAIEDIDHPLETQMTEVERRNEAGSPEPDYPEDDYTPGLNRDEDAAERRQALFDRQVAEETLQAHLMAQIPTSGVPEPDWPLAEVLVGDLDDNGYYRGSIPDVAMTFMKSEAEVVAVLAKIRELDPPGCGARDIRECLLSQVDDVPDPSVRELVRRIVDGHLGDLAEGRDAEIAAGLGVGEAEYGAALAALRSLDGRPGRKYPSERERVEYVNPEIHAVKRDGRWMAETDARSLPEIRFSRTFADLLRDPAQTAETKAYVRERIAAAQSFRDAVARRQETVSGIAQAIFDRQQEFFEGGFSRLKPLTELEIAEKVGVHGTTVSRTVRNKYADTPQGTVELRRFFATGVKTAEGSEISQSAALAALRAVIDGEDASAPLSDEKIAAKMKEAGIPVARRTVAKYRGILGIGGVSERRRPAP